MSTLNIKDIKYDKYKDRVYYKGKEILGFKISKKQYDEVYKSYLEEELLSEEDVKRFPKCKDGILYRKDWLKFIENTLPNGWEDWCNTCDLYSSKVTEDDLILSKRVVKVCCDYCGKKYSILDIDVYDENYNYICKGCIDYLYDGIGEDPRKDTDKGTEIVEQDIPISVPLNTSTDISTNILDLALSSENLDVTIIVKTSKKLKDITFQEIVNLLHEDKTDKFGLSLMLANPVKQDLDKEIVLEKEISLNEFMKSLHVNIIDVRSLCITNSAASYNKLLKSTLGDNAKHNLLTLAQYAVLRKLLVAHYE